MKSRLSPTEHAELGRVLASVHDELVRRSVQVANAYPHKERAVKELGAAVKALASARSVLDNALAIEHPGEFSPTAYYPLAADRLVLAEQEK